MSLAHRHAGALVLVACLLQSCGGGGGSDGGSKPPPPPPPPPPDIKLVPLIATEAPTYAGSSFYLAEDATFAMYVVTRAAQDLNENQLEPYVLSCTESGTVNLTANDANGNASLDAGDSITITYSSCNDRVSGTYALSITAVTFDEFLIKTLTGSLTFNITFLGTTSTLSGGGNLSYTAGGTSLTWLGTGFRVVYSDGSMKESLLDARVEKVFREDASYSFSFKGHIDSDFLGGRILVETSPRFLGAEGQWPTSGTLVVTGLDDSTIRYRPGFQFDSALYEVDADGNGIIDDLAEDIAWSEISSGFAFGVTEDSSVPPPNTGPDLISRRIALDGSAKDMTVNPSRGHVYVTIPSQNELLVFSAVSLEVVRRVRLQSRPSGLSVSADGSEIFVGLAASGAVAILNADTFDESRIFVAPELESSAVYKVIEAAPNVLYVGAGNSDTHSRIVRVDRGTGSVTPVATTGWAEIDLLADPARGTFYSADGFQAQVATVRKFDASDGVSKLAYSDTQTTLDQAHRMSLDPTGSRLYLSSGDVLDTSDFSRIGRISFGVPWASDSGSEVLVADRWGDLHVHSTATLGEIDTLETDCALPPAPAADFKIAQRLLPSPVDGQWLILGDEVLCAVDLLHPETPPGTGEPGVLPEPLPVVTVQSRSVHWGSPIADAAYDDARKRLYVTFYSAQDLVTVDAENAVILSREPLGHVARGLALSPDGSTLAIMFNDNGHLAFKDLATGTITTRDLTELLGTPAGYDVAWLDNDILFASADPPCCEEPFVAYLVRVSRSNPDADRRSADGVGNFWKSELAITPDRQSLFLNGGSGAHKIDLTQPGEPIVITRGTGGHNPHFSPDGSLLAFADGRILRTSDLFQVGKIEDNQFVFSPDGATLYGGFASFVDRFDAATFRPIDRLQAEDRCQPAWQLLATADGQEVISVAQTNACFFQVNQPVATAARKAAAHGAYVCGPACLERKHRRMTTIGVPARPRK